MIENILETHKLFKNEEVVNLELSRELKKLGVKQNSYFVWIWNCERNKPKDIFYEVWSHYDAYLRATNAIVASAFTSGELGKMLPEDYHTFKILNDGFDKKWVCKYFSSPEFDPSIEDFWASGNTEADARAEMIIYLIKEGTIKV